MTIELFHGSHEIVKEIHSGGTFGGIFTISVKEIAECHGDIIHKLEVQRSKILTHSYLNYHADYETVKSVILENINKCTEKEFEEIHSFIVEEANLWDSSLDKNRILEILKCTSIYEDIGDACWYCQKIRGLIAKKLGFDGVEMLDEHGTSYLILSCEKISII